MEKTPQLMHKRFESMLTTDGTELHGTLDEVVETGDFILNASGLPQPGLPISRADEGSTIRNMKQTTEDQELGHMRYNSSETFDDDSLKTQLADAQGEKRGKSSSSRKLNSFDTNDLRNQQFSNLAADEGALRNKTHLTKTSGSHMGDDVKPTTGVQHDSMHHKDDERNGASPMESNFKYSSGAANISTDMHPTTASKMQVKQEVASSPGRREVDSSENSTNGKKSFQTESAPSAKAGDCFITVDAITYQYIVDKYKIHIKDLEKKHNVKIKPSSTKSQNKTNQLFLEAKRVQKNKATDIQGAQEEFTNFYGDVFSKTRKETIAFKDLKKKDTKKVEGMLKKNFPKMIVSWDENGCTLFDEDAAVETAAEELRETLSGYGSMTVDKIGFRYLSTVHKDQLEHLKKKYNVTLDVQAAAAADSNQQTVLVKPIKKKKCTSQEVSDAKEDFITLYQKTFFSTRRTAVKCPGVSDEVIKEAIKLTKEKFANICAFKGATSDEVILCAEESISDDVIREFRCHAGVAPKRRLRKTISSDMEENRETHEQSQTDGNSITKETTLPPVFVTNEGLIVKVITDDLTKQTTDIIVNTGNSTLDFNGGVSKALSDAAGPELKKECKAILRGQYLKVGDCIHSNSFNLRCKYVIHVVAPRYNGNDKVRFGSGLSKAFASVLSTNEELITKSIALPLISSGNLGGPKEYCAKVLVTALHEFSRNHGQRHLQEVVLVNNEVETSNILQHACAEVFQAYRHSSDTVSENPQQTPNPSSHFKTSKGIDIIIENGDIAYAQVDIIVNAANKRLKHGRGVAGALAKAAGRELQDECDAIMSRRLSLKTGECIVTSGYRLKSRILHTVGPIYQERSSDGEFFQALKGTFVAAIRYANIPIEAKSIAIPLVSSGIYGGPKQMCADALLQAVEKFNMEPNLVIEKIVLINLDAEATQALYQAFSKQYSECASDTSSLNQRQEMGSDIGRKLMTRNGILLCITEGDITEQNVDAVVNPTDEFLRHQIGVAKAISDVAGVKLQEKCRDIMRTRGGRPLGIDEVIDTEGFGLNTKYILHTCTPIFVKTTAPSKRRLQQYHDTLRYKFEKCLQVAIKKRDVNDVALPLMGAGNTGAPKDLCAHALAKAIEAFEESDKHFSLKSIVLVSNDEEAIQAVAEAYDKCLLKEYPDSPGGDPQTSAISANGGNSSVIKSIAATETSHRAKLEQTRTHNGDQQRLLSDHGIDTHRDNVLDRGAKPKQWYSKGGIRSEEDVPPAPPVQQPGFISNYVVNPLMNLIGYNETPAQSKPQTDAAQMSPTSSAHSSVMENDRNGQESNLRGRKQKLGTQPTCVGCGVIHDDVYPLGGCKHTFCTRCISEHIVPVSKCLTCGKFYSIVNEDTLHGTMTYYARSNLSLPGEDESGAIEILYDFPGGTVPVSILLRS